MKIERVFGLPPDLQENIQTAGAELAEKFILPLIENDILGVYRAITETGCLGYVIVKVDLDTTGARELCIVYTATASRDFGKVCFKVYDYLAVLLNCPTIRIHSTSAAIDRAIEKNGFLKAETVYKRKTKIL